MSRRAIGRAGLSGLQSVGPAFAGRRVGLGMQLAVDRRLPLPGDVLVSPGDMVDCDTPVARALDVPAKLHVVDLAPVLGVPSRPEDVRKAVLVKPGEAVRAGQAVARVERAGWIERAVQEIASPAGGIVEFVSLGRGQIIIRAGGDPEGQRVALPVAAYLGLDARELPGQARCRPGQTVEVGDLLAKGPGIAMMASEFRSPVSGVVESISPLTGTIAILQEPREIILRAYLRGRVESVVPGYGVSIASRGHRILGVLGLGGKSWGRVRTLARAHGQANGGLGPLRGADIEPGHGGCVLVFPGEITAEALHECLRQGVRGVVAASAKAAQLTEFIGRPLAAEIVTGPGSLSLPGEPGRGRRGGGGPAAEPGLTVVLTEGLGSLGMDEEIRAMLEAHEGETASLDGLTQIRAGVVRPVVLLPAPETGGLPGGEPAAACGPAVPAEAVSLYVLPELERGMRVRLVRNPYFGCWGTVVEPPAGLTRLETEVEARVLRVRLDDGRVVAVAEANVEI